MWPVLEFIKEHAIESSHISPLKLHILLSSLRLMATGSLRVWDVHKGETDQRILVLWTIANNYKGMDEFSPVISAFGKHKLMLDICEPICSDAAPDVLRKNQDPLPFKEMNTHNIAPWWSHIMLLLLLRVSPNYWSGLKYCDEHTQFYQSMCFDQYPTIF